MKTTMKHSYYVQLFLITVLAFYAGSGFFSWAQQAIGVLNGNFETGNLNGWVENGQVSIISTGADPVTGNSLQQVAEGKYSAMIGDSTPWQDSGDQQSSLEQEVVVDQNLPTGAVLQFTYAMIANDPPNHPEQDKPGFRVFVQDMDTQEILTDTNYVYTSQTSGDWYLGQGINNSSLVQQPFNTLNQDRWVFRPWTEVQVPVDGRNGHLLKIMFDVKDCNWGAHAIYGLLDQVQIGSPQALLKPALLGNPPKAIFIDPPFWSGMLQWLEQLRLIWLCCLLPLLFLFLLPLLWLLLKRQTSKSSYSTPTWTSTSSGKKQGNDSHRGGGATP